MYSKQWSNCENSHAMQIGAVNYQDTTLCFCFGQDSQTKQDALWVAKTMLVELFSLFLS